MLFPIPAQSLDTLASEREETQIVSHATDDSDVLSSEEIATITHRRGQTRFLEPHAPVDSDSPEDGNAAASLCRLAFELAKSPDQLAVADLALAGLFKGTRIDAGGVLLLPRNHTGEPTAAELDVVASRTDNSVAVSSRI